MGEGVGLAPPRSRAGPRERRSARTPPQKLKLLLLLSLLFCALFGCGGAAEHERAGGVQRQRPLCARGRSQLAVAEPLAFAFSVPQSLATRTSRLPTFSGAAVGHAQERLQQGVVVGSGLAWFAAPGRVAFMTSRDAATALMQHVSDGARAAWTAWFAWARVIADFAVVERAGAAMTSRLRDSAVALCRCASHHCCVAGARGAARVRKAPQRARQY